MNVLYFVGMWAAFSMTESLKLTEKSSENTSKCSNSVTAGDSVGLPSMAVCWEYCGRNVISVLKLVMRELLNAYHGH